MLEVLFHTEEHGSLNGVTEHSAISVGFYAITYWKPVILDYNSILQALRWVLCCSSGSRPSEDYVYDLHN